ncbi:MAG: hypothetical protein ACRDRX_16875 [Pseudonocardiaceae bacterium]
MSTVIVIEIVIGIVVLAAAVRFAVRDTMQRETSRDSDPEPSLEPAVGSVDTTRSPEPSSVPEPAQPLSEVGSTETS